MKVMLVSAVIVVIDQITKAVTRSAMMLGESKPVIKNFFHFTYVTNDGMAFGLNFPGGIYFFTSVSLLMTVFLGWYFWQQKESDLTLRLSLALILAGAIGNLIDRMLFGTVVDFFDFMIGSYHWYIFNVADASVTIGMILYIYDAVLKQSEVNPTTKSI